MSTIGIVYQPKIEAAARLAETTVDRLRALGHDSWRASAWDGDDMVAALDESAAVLTMGGDGTVLRAARICAPRRVPILAVNFGRIGFITEVEPDEFDVRLADYLAGRFWIEHRTMIEARVLPGGRTDIDPIAHLAMNDVVVSRGTAARVIKLETSVDGQPFTTFTSDGAIVSTPTGSTAYSLAAGGPILDPALATFVLTPIAAHLGLRQSIVLPADARVAFVVRSDHGAVVSVDGQLDLPLDDGDAVEVTRSATQASLVRVKPRTEFYRTLAERLTRRLLTRNE